MSFDRNRLPEPTAYFESRGLQLTGRGKWRTARCEFHGGSDSLRIRVDEGCWICMACGAKGGDVVSYEMQRHGLDFVAAAKALGAWVEDRARAPSRPRAFSASDALAALHADLHVCAILLSDARRGVIPTDDDWRAFLAAAGRAIRIAEEVRT